MSLANVPLTTAGVQPVPTATLAQDTDPTAQLPKAEPVKLYHEVEPSREQLIYLFTAWGVMDRNIPYHKPQLRNLKPKEPQKSGAMEKQVKGKAAVAKPPPAEEEMGKGLDYLALGPPADAYEPLDQNMEAADVPAEGPPPPAEGEAGQDEEIGDADQPAGGGASGGDPREDPPDPEKTGSPPEDEVTPMEEEEKEDEKEGEKTEEWVALEPERADAEEQGEPEPGPAERSCDGWTGSHAACLLHMCGNHAKLLSTPWDHLV
ncbi:hypothetical protein KFL_013250010, partial [Klebsormidium nitens]